MMKRYKITVSRIIYAHSSDGARYAFTENLAKSLRFIKVKELTASKYAIKK